MIETIIISLLTIFSLVLCWCAFKPQGNKEIEIGIKEMKRKLSLTEDRK